MLVITFAMFFRFSKRDPPAIVMARQISKRIVFPRIPDLLDRDKLRIRRSQFRRDRERKPDHSQ